MNEPLTFADASQHIDYEVLVDDGHTVRDGRIVAVDVAKQLVRIRLRYKAVPYRWSQQFRWVPAQWLSIPEAWARRAEVRRIGAEIAVKDRELLDRLAEGPDSR